MKTASQEAIDMGCKSLSQVARWSDVSTRTLNNWQRERRFAFLAVCERVAKLYQEQLEQEKEGENHSND